MPSRIIRESCTTSPNLAALSNEAERTFWRLLTVADDWGRFNGDPSIIFHLCYPLPPKGVTKESVCDDIRDLLINELVVLYESNCREYGFFKTWNKHQHIRSKYKKSKFPDPETPNQEIPLAEHLSDNSTTLARQLTVVVSSKGEVGRGKGEVGSTPKGILSDKQTKNNGSRKRPSTIPHPSDEKLTQYKNLTEVESTPEEIKP